MYFIRYVLQPLPQPKPQPISYLNSTCIIPLYMVIATVRISPRVSHKFSRNFGLSESFWIGDHVENIRGGCLHLYKKHRIWPTDRSWKESCEQFIWITKKFRRVLVLFSTVYGKSHIFTYCSWHQPRPTYFIQQVLCQIWFSMELSSNISTCRLLRKLY